MSNVVHLHKPPQKIAHYLRVGFREHVLADRMRTEGRLSQFGLVFEACNVPAQKELMREVAADGHELILDTNVAEQSAPGRYSGSVSRTPWAKADRPLGPEDCRPVSNVGGITEPIARFAVENGFHSVLSPSHYLGGDQARWLEIDLRNCEALRVALDAAGGAGIRIYHELILSNAQLKDTGFVTKVVEQLRSLPLEALWLRISGFGGDATGAGVDKAAQAILRFHGLGIPIVMDRVGGLPAYALTSFGVASGYANGLKGKDRFDTSGWLKSTGRGGGGNETSVFISGLDRRVTRSELKELFDHSTTARSIFGCRDTSCCGSVESMLREPEAHHLTEQRKTLTDLSAIPELLRGEQFLDKNLGAERKKAERSLKLKNASDDFRKLSGKAATRLARMEKALEQTMERLGKIDFAPEATLPTNVVRRTARMDGGGHR